MQHLVKITMNGLGGIALCMFLSGCVRPMYPVWGTFPMPPRMIQPVDSRTNTRTLPSNPNFVQSYQKHTKTKTNSRFGALIRWIEFEYDLQDSMFITARITSGFDEGSLTGEMTIFLDQYELTYKSQQVVAREYVEEISYEARESVQNPSLLQNPVRAAINQSNSETMDRVMRRSQLFNTVQFTIEPEDRSLMQKTKTLSYQLALENCDITIYPSKEQILMLKEMLAKYSL